MVGRRPPHPPSPSRERGGIGWFVPFDWLKTSGLGHRGGANLTPRPPLSFGSAQDRPVGRGGECAIGVIGGSVCFESQGAGGGREIGEGVCLVEVLAAEVEEGVEAAVGFYVLGSVVEELGGVATAPSDVLAGLGVVG